MSVKYTYRVTIVCDMEIEASDQTVEATAEVQRKAKEIMECRWIEVDTTMPGAKVSYRLHAINGVQVPQETNNG